MSDQGQKFMPLPAPLQQEEQAFEFQPLDLKQLSGEQPPARTKVRRRVRIACPICGQPWCFLEREVEIEEASLDHG